MGRLISSILMAAYRLLRKVLSLFGFHLLRRHYYQPIPEVSELGSDFFNSLTPLVGIEMNEERALELIRTVFPLYREEFRSSFPIERGKGAGGDRFYLINGTYMAVDADVYYAFIRHFRPRRIIEIGGGMSSLLAAAACRRNYESTGHQTVLTVIEPYPGPALKGGVQGIELIEQRLQDVDPAFFRTLGGGDILFIDSTHVLRAGGDVQLEYLEIIPSLAPGVLVHIHDISLPKPYPKVYFESGLYWNEQYLLQAFLAFNSSFEVLWPGNYMMINYPEQMLAAFPDFRVMRQQFPQSEPSSFWIRRNLS